MTATTNGMLNTAFVKRYRCATCWGALVEKVVEGAWCVVCPKACQPGGFVTAEHVETRRAAAGLEYAEVIANYPQFARPVADAERGKHLLFGG